MREEVLHEKLDAVTAQVVSTRKMLNLLLQPSCMTKSKIEYGKVVPRYKSVLKGQLQTPPSGKKEPSKYYVTLKAINKHIGQQESTD